MFGQVAPGSAAVPNHWLHASQDDDRQWVDRRNNYIITLGSREYLTLILQPESTGPTGNYYHDYSGHYPSFCLLFNHIIIIIIKTRLNSGNGCYYSVQNLLSSRLLSKNVKIRVYNTIILPVVLYG
jgi:hypothetical protein